MNIARIRDGIVINIETVDEDWSDPGNSDDILVPYTDNQPAFVGLTWTEADGFEQQPAPEEPVIDPGSSGL